METIVKNVSKRKAHEVESLLEQEFERHHGKDMRIVVSDVGESNTPVLEKLRGILKGTKITSEQVKAARVKERYGNIY